MRRRFGRGRRRPANESRGTPIDAALWLPRILESGAVPATALDPIRLDGVPDSFAVLGEGERPDGGAVRVGFAPERGADAALAVLALEARRRAEGAAGGDVYAVAIDWSAAARRRLGLLRATLSFEAVGASSLAGGGVRVSSESPAELVPVAPRQLAGRLTRDVERQGFLRALSGFEGLAAKHGGALRARGDRVELALLARRVAALVAEPGGVRIEVIQPERATLSLGDGEGLAAALDRLEGTLRKLLNDKKIRSSEVGLRCALMPLLERAEPLAARCVWPLGGADGEPIEWVGITAAGRAVVGTSRERLGLPALAEILDAAASSGGVAQALARDLELAPPSDPPRLVVAAGEFEPAALDVLSVLELDLLLFDAVTRRGGEWVLEPREREVPASGASQEGTTRRAPSGATPERSRPPGEARRSSTPKVQKEKDEEEGPEPRRFEEVSLFDLDDEPRSEEAGVPGSGGRRRRGRRRGRRGRGSDVARGERRPMEEAAAGDSEPSDEASPRGSSRDEDDEEDDAFLATDDEETLAPLVDDVPEIDEVETPSYEDEEEEEEEDGERSRREREPGRRERAVKPEAPPPPPRRRAAFVAHADPVSVLTAVVLARDVRLVESFWVYPQSELMTFFRSVATDLREETPIFLVGFAASPPARDTFQAAALYRGRLDWFDHHEWPPEDLGTLRETIGADHVHVSPGSENSLASVIAQRTRRSRFSDKLVELVTGRFTQHDYERWGRLWWHRAHEIAGRPGDRRTDIAPLLAGRPSDLAREAAREPEPPVPPEVAYVSERDFRLVHFGGLTMVVIEGTPELDLHLAARIARERYEAQLSLATLPGQEFVVLGGDDTRTRRGLDLGGMTSHLAAKHEWVEALPDDDHVARMRVRGLHTEPGRFDELITEIAMGRSIIEG